MLTLKEERDLGPLLTNFDLLVDPNVGIINRLEEIATNPGDPNFFHFAASACNTSVFVENRNFHNTGGAAVDRMTAVAKAMGEAIERYSAAIYRRDDLPLASANDAEFAVINPTDFALYTSAQFEAPGFPWAAFDSDSLLRWTPVTDIASGEIRHAPAAFVWIPYSFDRDVGEAPIGQPISTGLACHRSLDKARLSGLSEVLERDCFTLFWQAMCTPPHIRVETLPDDSYDMVERFAATGDKVRLFDITADNGVPCLLAVLSSAKPDRPAYVFAASCDLDPAVAARKALEELAHTRRYSQRIKDNLAPVSAADNWAQVLNQHDHLNFAGDAGNAALIEPLLASEERLDFDQLESLASGDDAGDVAEYCERIGRTGHTAYFADLTSPDIAGLGLHVGRTLVPGYHPLFMGHAIRALGGDRLYTVPQKLGHPGIEPGGDNPAPHPYP